MNIKVFYFVVVLLVLTANESKQDCKVLAECDGEIVGWKSWPAASTVTNTGAAPIVGRPGKRGLRGERGQKGEPGLGVDLEDLKDQLQTNHTGPTMHYYKSTMTWNSGPDFCSMQEKRLCYARELCVNNNGGLEFLFDVIPGDHWVPVWDSENEWMEAGDSGRRTCHLHFGNHGYKPAWGTSNKSGKYKGYIFCCEHERESGKNDIKYQYIGKALTYESSNEHCAAQGLRLCRSDEVCQRNSPVFGVIHGDVWIAVSDKANEWVEIGNSGGRTCWIHGQRYGLPSWGIRTDGSLNNALGYVYCCKK